MVKLTSLSSALAAGLMLLSAATAQIHGVPARPAPPRPSPPPALASQPLVDTNNQPTPAMVKPVKVKPAKPQPKVDPATKGVKLGGTRLKRAVAKIKKMPWHKSLRECQLKAKTAGKPILYLQTLGDLGGFA